MQCAARDRVPAHNTMSMNNKMIGSEVGGDKLPDSTIPTGIADTLDTIQKRVLWLAMNMIHHANAIRPNPDSTKVGGHQASSASMVTIMTALYFHFLKAGDRVSVKPHASPVFHAIQFLLGKLPRKYLTELRAYRGLQAYPSRTKDVDVLDFSTGSVGFGAVAPAFAALAHQYCKAHFGDISQQRFVGLLGDAEMDEGNVWEAVLDQALDGLGNLLWIVDLNRQSLDRVVPGIRAAQLKALFAESGWQVLEAKYGRVLQSLFARPGGAALRQRIDEMRNAEYQAIIRMTEDSLRVKLATVDGVLNTAITDVISDIPDSELTAVVCNLGGHDLDELLSVLAQVDEAPEQPTILFAYTIKGWRLPMAGHPLNHSMLLNQEQMDDLRHQLDVPTEDEWASFAPDSPSGRMCQEMADRLYPETTSVPKTLLASELPARLSVSKSGHTSTQQTFGRLLMAISREPKLAERIVTASPDVSTSTNLSGWILKMGVYAPQKATSYEREVDRYSHWRQGPEGQHIELGISEMNLFMMLGMFGLSTELIGEQLIPIGTVYDPFVLRGLESLIYGLYSGARFIFAGTPSGISLSPEGGAHQSTISPSVGIEIPNLRAVEPCFAQEMEWMILEALRDCCDQENGRTTYLRLSTKPIDQSLLEPALNRLGEQELRRQVLSGGYRLVDWREVGPTGQDDYLVHIATSGAMVPEAIEAAHLLREEGIPVNVLNLTSPRSLFEKWRGKGSNLPDSQNDPFADLIPLAESRAPIVTVLDGASHTLSWLGSVNGSLVIPLGVDQFGQSGTRDDLYHHHGIDAESIVNAGFEALRRTGLS